MIRIPRKLLDARAQALAVAVGVLVAAPLAAGAPAAVNVQLAPGASAAALPDGATPLIDPADAAVLEDRAALRGRSIPDLGRWYQVPAGSAAEAAALARRLDAPAGQRAEVQLPPAPPPRASCRTPLAAEGWPEIPASGPVPDLSAAEEHRTGLRLPVEADGAGIRVGDVEYSWRATHEELASRGLPLAPGQDATTDHGTSVLSVIGAAADAQGTTGLAPAAELLPRVPFVPSSDASRPPAYNVAGAIASLAAELRPGDVLLIEQQAWTDASLRSLGPVEVNLDARQAIRAATSAGIVVIEPAGNGVYRGDEGVNLDGFGIPLEGEPGYSGAIMVGAGQSSFATGGGTDLQRESFSNYGRRVDVQGYGESVVTAGGSGDPDDIGGPAPDRTYTACFNGTSSAAATIAGAVAGLQSFARARLGAPLDPRVLRRRIIDTGLPQQDPATGTIGPRPQVEIALPPPPDPDAAGPAPVAAPPAPAAAAAPVTSSGLRATVPAARGGRVLLAASGASASLTPATGRVTVRLRGLAPRATVRVGGRAVRAVGGRLVLRARPGTVLVLEVSAPRRGALRYRPARIRVTVTRAGGIRVAVTSPTSRARP